MSNLIGEAQVKIKIDKEFSNEVLSQPPYVLKIIEESILSKGCLEALLVWEETGILLDGHTRHEICKNNNVPYKLKPLPFPDRQSALQFMRQHQHERRNLTPKQRLLVIGREYNALKKAPHRPAGSKKGGQKVPLKTARGCEGARDQNQVPIVCT